MPSKIHTLVPQLLTRDEVAARIGIQVATLRRWIAQGCVVPASPGCTSDEVLDLPPLADIGMRSFGHVDDIDAWAAEYRAAQERSRKAANRRGR